MKSAVLSFAIVACLTLGFAGYVSTANAQGTMNITSSNFRILPQCPETGCRACDFVALVNNVVRFLLIIAPFIAVLMFAAAGFSAIINPGSGKELINMAINVIVGIVIMLVAWLVVDTVLKVLTGGKFGPWNQIQCVSNPEFEKFSLKPSGSATVVPGGTKETYGSGDPGVNGTQGEQTTPTNTSGKCEPVSNSGSACNTANLGSYSDGTFARNLDQASRICNYESGGGNANAESSTDRLNSGGREPFSVGLFQINLTVHQLQGCSGGTLNCPSAFSGRNYSATIVNRDLYNQCVAAAKDPSCNVRNAERIYREGGNSWRPWRNTANACSISF